MKCRNTTGERELSASATCAADGSPWEEAPACVQACPHEAISIRLVDTRQVVEDSETNLFLPGVPEPTITYPTTTYETKRVFPRNTLPAHYHSLHPEHAHWPLFAMLVLTQLSVGAFLVAWCSNLTKRLRFSEHPAAQCDLAGWRSASCARDQRAALGVPAIRLSCADRPQAFVAESGDFGFRCIFRPRVAIRGSKFRGAHPPALLRGLGTAVGLSGLAGIFCSVCVYAVTRRALWSGCPARASGFS